MEPVTPSRIRRRRLVAATMLVAASCTIGASGARAQDDTGSALELAAPLPGSDTSASASGPAGLMATPQSLVATSGVGIDPYDPAAVLSAWGDIYSAQLPPAMGFTGTVSTCQPGSSSAAYRSAQLKVVNGFRKLAGLNPVVENATWTSVAQAAALTMAANNRISHTIDATWNCYSAAAATGASTSNLALGYEGPNAMVAYVGDGGTNNTVVGHRRWVLCPNLGGVGLGNAPGVNAMTVMGPGALPAGGQTRDGFVAWPNKGVLPVGLAQGLGLLDRYSVQVGADESVAQASLSITSSAAATNGAVGVTELTLSDQLYCGPALVWRTTRAPVVGESWTFTVSGVANRSTGATRTLTWTTQMTDLTPPSSFITASFVDFLGRQPTAAEVNAYVKAVWTNTMSRTTYLSTLANSSEWLSVIVRKMYLDTLGREPDPAGLATWVDWIRSGRFTVAQAASLFYSSQEFYLGAGQNDREVWVGRLYAKLLGRSPDPTGLAFWVARSNDPAHGLSGVAFEFFQSQESRVTRVQALYAAFLGRSPDPVGWTFWADVIVGSGDINLAVSLAASTEYDLRAQARY